MVGKGSGSRRNWARDEYDQKRDEYKNIVQNSQRTLKQKRIHKRAEAKCLAFDSETFAER